MSAQSLQELLAVRPELVLPPLEERANEEPAQRLQRLQNWETAHAQWVQDVAEVSELGGTTPDDLRIVEFTPEGEPVFSGDDNVRAAAAGHSHFLQAPPINANGFNEIAGQWESGVARGTHQEFAGIEGTSRIIVGDSANISDHATHVAGTIAAGGFQANALGMAPQSIIRAWDSKSDLSEMTSESATSWTDYSSIAVSNHSFGGKIGWHFTSRNGVNNGNSAWFWLGSPAFNFNSEDLKFGVYSQRARDLDDQQACKPYHLLIRSAGNERTNGPQTNNTYFVQSNNLSWVSGTYDPTVHPGRDGSASGGYDTLPADKISKNPLHVGAWNQIMFNGVRTPTRAQTSGFSSWGPTNDGRLKPEVVAQGVALTSPVAFTPGSGGATVSNSDYDSYSGTSMSTPMVTGLATQLQSIHRLLFNPSRRMTAAELKGLLIHSADDVGPIGPDYQSGYGWVNGLSARFILNELAQNRGPFKKLRGTVFTDGSTSEGQVRQSYDLEFKGGENFGLKATLVWLDPASDVPQNGQSSAPLLLNDLDLRIIGPDDEIYEPFILDPSSPQLLATTGDNSLDPVEQVIVPNARPGRYEVIVSTKESEKVLPQGFVVWLTPIMDPLSVRDLTMEIPAEGGTLRQLVHSLHEWSIDSLDSWVRTDRGSYDGRQEIPLRVSPNLSPMPRVATISIRTQDERGALTFRILQEGAPQPPLGTTLADAVDQPGESFTSNGTTPWIPQAVSAITGGLAGASGAIGDQEESEMRLTVTGPARVRFRYRVDSESGRDEFQFKRNDSLFIIADGLQSAWTERTIVLFDDPEILRWIYKKDQSLAVGSDRAFVDAIRIDYARVQNRDLIFTHAEQTGSFQIDASGSTIPYSIDGNVPSWINFEQTSDTGSGPLNFTCAFNFSRNPRTASFRIGSDTYGWQTVTVTQFSVPGPPPEPAEVVDLSTVNEIYQEGDGAPWVTLNESEINDEPAFAISGHEQPDAQNLVLNIEGPGVFSFTYLGDYQEIDTSFPPGKQDWFGIEIGAESIYFPPGDNPQDATVYLPKGAQELKIRFDPNRQTFESTVQITNFRFTPVSIELEENGFPSSGGTTDFTLDFEAVSGPSWAWLALGNTDFVSSNISSGTGDEVLALELSPDPVGLGKKTFGLQLENHGVVSFDLEQKIPAWTTLDDGLDYFCTPLQTIPSASDINSTLRSQDAITFDGQDAIRMGYGVGTEEITTTIELPAYVSFQYLVKATTAYDLRFEVSGVAFLQNLNGASDEWHRHEVYLPGTGSETLRISMVSGHPCFIDRLQMRQISDSGKLLDGGTANIPFDGIADQIEFPIGSSASLRTFESLQILDIPSLPDGQNSRCLPVTINGKSEMLLQVRTDAINSRYAFAHGATSVLEIFRDPILHPLADLDHDGLMNSLEFVTGRDPRIPDRGNRLSKSGTNFLLELGKRPSEWMEPVYHLSEDLADFDRIVMTETAWSLVSAAYSLVLDSEDSGSFRKESKTYVIQPPAGGGEEPAQLFVREGIRFR